MARCRRSAQVKNHIDRGLIEHTDSLLKEHLDTDDDADEGTNGERHQETQHLCHAGAGLRAAAETIISIACSGQLWDDTCRLLLQLKAAEGPWSRRRASPRSLQAGLNTSPAHLHKAGADRHALHPFVRSHRNKCCHHVAIGALHSSAQPSEMVSHASHACCVSQWMPKCACATKLANKACRTMKDRHVTCADIRSLCSDTHGRRLTESPMARPSRMACTMMPSMTRIGEARSQRIQPVLLRGWPTPGARYGSFTGATGLPGATAPACAACGHSNLFHVLPSCR